MPNPKIDHQTALALHHAVTAPIAHLSYAARVQVLRNALIATIHAEDPAKAPRRLQRLADGMVSYYEDQLGMSQYLTPAA